MTRTPAHFDLRRESPRRDGCQPFSAPTRITRLLFSTGSLGEVEAVWWPRTQNLSIELHDLVVALTPRLGPVARIRFDWNAISAMQRQIDSDDGLDVTGPEPGQPCRVMRVDGRNGSRIDIVIVEPGADTAYGYRQMAPLLDSPAELVGQG